MMEISLNGAHEFTEDERDAIFRAIQPYITVEQVDGKRIIRIDLPDNVLPRNAIFDQVEIGGLKVGDRVEAKGALLSMYPGPGTVINLAPEKYYAIRVKFDDGYVDNFVTGTLGKIE